MWTYLGVKAGKTVDLLRGSAQIQKEDIGDDGIELEFGEKDNDINEFSLAPNSKLMMLLAGPLSLVMSRTKLGNGLAGAHVETLITKRPVGLGTRVNISGACAL